MPINPEHSTRIAPRSVSRFYQDVDERGTTPVYHFSSEFRSKEMVNAAVEGISHAFPVRGRHYTLEVDNVHGESRSVSEQEEKDAVINSKSILVPIKGDVKLVQNSTGKVVSEARDYPLAKCPIATNRNTYILEGNNYSISHQLVLRPGAYVREDDNGDLETHFNTGSGQSFRLTMDPKSMLFYIVPRPGSSKYLLIPVLAALGVAGQLEGLMGKEVLHANLVASSGQEEKVITGLFSKIAPREMQATHPNFSEMKGLLPEIFSGMSLDPKTTRITLGAEHEHVNAQALLASLAKMIAVYKGEQEQDNRDSLSFKKVVRPPDMIVNRFVKGRNTVASKLKNSLIFRLDNAKEYNVRSVLPANYFTKVITNFFQTSSLAYNPTETNPMDNVENMGKVTSLGEGGIEDENQIPLSARALDPSHFSVLDLVRTPESSHAGVDVRFGVNTTLGKNGEIYQQLYNKEGKSVKMATYRSAEYVIGFPEEKRGDKVLAVDHGKMALVDPKKVDFWYGEADNFFGPLTSLIPFANSDHPNRLVMAGKALPQALSLVKREVPLVQTMSQDNIPYSFKWGHPYSKKAKEEGVVLEVSPDHIKTTAETIPLVHNIPFNQKGFVDYTPSVSVGDKVRRGTVVADSNYTKNGFLALGKNLRVAYMPYKGFNFEDGIVISQAAAEQMTSQHMYVEKATLGRSVTTDLRLLKKYYKDKFQPSQLQGLDSKGFPVVGRVLHKGDPIFVFFEKREPTAEEKMLGRLHKSLLKPYGIITEYWAHDEPGTVVEVGYHNYNLRVVIRTESAATVGDKLTGLHGNKGVITKVLPDEMMPHDTHGTKMDLLLNPAGVTSRVNLGQLMETAAGKIAEHDKEFYRIHPFKTGDNLKTIKAELAKRGLSDRDVLINPETGKPFESPVFTGKQYIIKLNKTADSGYSARGEGPTYDREGQPKKGGLEGAKKIGFMEWLGLLASDARHNLREMGTIKSEKGEHWGKFVEGTALPLPQMTFATQKFLHSLTGAGIHVKEGDGKWKATPLTNAEILRASKGEIQNPGMLRAKDLEPEKGGLFDTVLTGGRQGERFNHFTLAEPVLNPALETSVQNLLGLTQVQMIPRRPYQVRQGRRHEETPGAPRLPQRRHRQSLPPRAIKLRSRGTLPGENHPGEIRRLHRVWGREPPLPGQHVGQQWPQGAQERTPGRGPDQGARGAVRVREGHPGLRGSHLPGHQGAGGQGICQDHPWEFSQDRVFPESPAVQEAGFLRQVGVVRKSRIGHRRGGGPRGLPVDDVQDPPLACPGQEGILLR